MKSFISAIFKSFILSLTLIAQVNFAYAQSQGGLIPNGKSTFLDNNGNPISGGKVYYYIPSTTTAKPTYQDINQTVPNTNPVVLDAAGRALIWGTGNYRQQVFDKNNNLIWDVETSTNSTATSPVSTGDGDLVGTIKPWAGISAPNQYMFTYGEQLSRSAYSVLFTAITSTQNVSCSTSGPTATGLTDTTNFWIGMTVELSCVSGGVTTIIAKTSSSVTLAATPNVNGVVSATFFPWGNGDGSTTFNLPDFRGLIPVGNNIMGGVASTNLTTTYFGSATPNSAGGQGGSQSVTLAQNQLPNIAPTFTGTSGTATSQNSNIPINAVGVFNLNTGGGVNAISGNIATSLLSAFTPSGTISSINGNVTQQSFGIIPPAKTVNFIIKVTPDSNSAVASGVTSLGGMTGSIACGTGIICTGNTISSTTVNAAALTASNDTNVTATLTGSPSVALLQATGITLGWSGTLAAGRLNSNVVQNCTNDTNITCSISAQSLTLGWASVLSLARGGTGQATAPLSRSCTGLNIDCTTTATDANYNIQSTDRLVYHTSLSAARLDTLPAASSFNKGQVLIIADFNGVASGTNTVTVQISGSDTINGVTNIVAIGAQYGAAILWSDGISKWTYFPASSGGGSGTVTNITCNNGLLGGSITSTGTCSVDPTFTAANFGGRLTAQSSTPVVTTDQVSSQNLYYVPYVGRSVPIYNSTAWGLYPFTSSATDQVGLTLNLGGSSNWAANTLFDVFAILSGGNPILATRVWDSGMLPTTPQITNATTITTGTTPTAWTRSTAAFNGTPIQNGAASATIQPSNSGLNNCLGQDWGSGNSYTVSQVTIVAPTDHYFLGGSLTNEDARLYGSNDNTNWYELSIWYFNDTISLGNSFTFNTNIDMQQPYRYHRVCFDGQTGSNNLYVAQVEFFQTVAPSGGRRLINYGGILVNDNSMTARVSSSSTTTVGQYQGTYLGTIHTDDTNAGKISSYVTWGTSRTDGVWNMYNRQPKTLKAGVPSTSSNYTVTNGFLQECNGANSGFSVEVLNGYADEPISLKLARQSFFVGAAGYNTMIGVDSTNSFSGNIAGTNVDTTGQDIGFNQTAFFTMQPYAGIHTFYCVEQNNGNVGTATTYNNARQTALYAQWKN